MNKQKLLLALSALTVSGSTLAAVPAEATAAIDAIQTDGLALIASGWPVFAALVGGMILFKLTRKVISKVS